MSINPMTLKTVRTRLGLSLQDLADRTSGSSGGAVSKRQIARIESGETAPDRVRGRTVRSLADALGVNMEDLCDPEEGVASADTWQGQVGYRHMRVKALVLPTTPMNYALVTHHYRVSVDDLIDAAPWMFTLLAEISLERRRRSLADVENAVSDTATEHITCLLKDALAVARSSEENSLGRRDIFGDSLPLDFKNDITNPFVNTIQELARDAGSSAIDPDDCVAFPLFRTSWVVFTPFLERLTAGDVWANRAIDYGFVKISEIPEELLPDSRSADRVAWLAAKVPQSDRERMQREDEEREWREDR